MLQQTLWWYIATLPRGTQINVSRLGHIWPVECIEMNKNCFRFSTERHIQQLQRMQGKSWASGPTCLKSPSRRWTKVQNHWPKKPLMLVRTSVTNGSIHFGIPFGIPKMLIQKLTKLFQSSFIIISMLNPNFCGPFYLLICCENCTTRWQGTLWRRRIIQCVVSKNGNAGKFDKPWQLGVPYFRENP